MANDPVPQVNDPLIGRVLAEQYYIESLMARGGMGNIYLARQQRLGKVVVVKVLRHEFCKDERVIKRFLREALAVSQLNHPHTAQVFDSGETPEGVHYIIMEYLEGESLDRRIARDGHLAPALAVSFVGQTAAALAEAHAKGIVHRDLKPSNIFIVSPHGVPEFVKVLDFGIAKFYAGRDAGELTKLTAAGSTMGTPHYMAPEQIRGEEVDARADIYSLGVILWEALTGRPPFSGDSPMEIFLGHLEHKLPKLSQLYPQLKLPPGLEEILRKCLAKKPGDRFRSAHELKQALDMVAVSASPSLASQRLRLNDINAYSPPVPTELNRRAMGRRLRFWIGTVSAAVAAVAVLSLLLIWLIKDKEQHQTAAAPVAQAYVKVFSEPAGADVLLDHQLRGVTPTQLSLSPPKQVSIEIRAAGLEAVIADVSPSDKEVRGLIVALQSSGTGTEDDESMNIWVETEPSGALVSVNGQALGERTPCRVKTVANGSPIELILQRDGFLDERYVTVTQPGSTLVMNSRLVPR
ncbi:MAG: protein kinase [Myxococcota bacterium]|jgi:serine/threonine protein kinase|nr:protein kinase [Myxococcota bacterium]